MNHLRNGSLYISEGDTSSIVRYIQRKLSIEPDSNFGPGTRDAVVSFQSENGLTPDGIVGVSSFLVICADEIEIRFNRTMQKLKIELSSSIENLKVLFECKAISGLPAAHTRVSELIREGRKDLSMETNYMSIEYDGVSDVGPIPDGSYDLTLTQDMPFQKTEGGWGVGGWYLDPGYFSRGFYRLGWTRGGFFLHHDGNGLGTGGCIGVSEGRNILRIQSILTTYQDIGNSSIEIIVA
ncbi:MAG: peptidoglycan-binding protein [Crocinitomicaceae bacterium]